MTHDDGARHHGRLLAGVGAQLYVVGASRAGRNLWLLFVLLAVTVGLLAVRGADGDNPQGIHQVPTTHRLVALSLSGVMPVLLSFLAAHQVQSTLALGSMLYPARHFRQALTLMLSHAVMALAAPLLAACLLLAGWAARPLPAWSQVDPFREPARVALLMVAVYAWALSALLVAGLATFLTRSGYLGVVLATAAFWADGLLPPQLREVVSPVAAVRNLQAILFAPTPSPGGLLPQGPVPEGQPLPGRVPDPTEMMDPAAPWITLLAWVALPVLAWLCACAALFRTPGVARSGHRAIGSREAMKNTARKPGGNA